MPSSFRLTPSIPAQWWVKDHSSWTLPYFPSGDLSEGKKKKKNRLSCRLKMASGLRGTLPPGNELKRRKEGEQKRAAFHPFCQSYIIYCFLLRQFPMWQKAPCTTHRQPSLKGTRFHLFYSLEQSRLFTFFLRGYQAESAGCKGWNWEKVETSSHAEHSAVIVGLRGLFHVRNHIWGREKKPMTKVSECEHSLRLLSGN